MNVKSKNTHVFQNRDSTEVTTYVFVHPLMLKVLSKKKKRMYQYCTRIKTIKTCTKANTIKITCTLHIAQTKIKHCKTTSKDSRWLNCQLPVVDEAIRKGRDMLDKLVSDSSKAATLYLR